MVDELDELVVRIRDQINEEIERVEFVGYPMNESTLQNFDFQARKAYSSMLGIPIEQIELIDLRVEDEGKTIAWNGIQLK